MNKQCGITHTLSLSLYRVKNILLEKLIRMKLVGKLQGKPTNKENKITHIGPNQTMKLLSLYMQFPRNYSETLTTISLANFPLTLSPSLLLGVSLFLVTLLRVLQINVHQCGLPSAHQRQRYRVIVVTKKIILIIIIKVRLEI